MDIIKAYEILDKHKEGEGRTMWHRIAALLVSNSLLLVAFFQSLQPNTCEIIPIVLALVAIILNIGFVVLFIIGVRTQLHLKECLREIEREPYFDYLKEKKGRPQSDISDGLPNCMQYYSVVIPILFIVIWGFCVYQIFN